MYVGVAAAEQMSVKSVPGGDPQIKVDMRMYWLSMNRACELVSDQQMAPDICK